MNATIEKPPIIRARNYAPGTLFLHIDMLGTAPPAGELFSVGALWGQCGDAFTKLVQAGMTHALSVAGVMGDGDVFGVFVLTQGIWLLPCQDWRRGLAAVSAALTKLGFSSLSRIAYLSPDGIWIPVFPAGSPPFDSDAIIAFLRTNLDIVSVMRPPQKS